jgi:phospholipid-binding lipoprotein MlaA
MHTRKNSEHVLRATLVALAFALSACTSIPADQKTESDPWEPLNRSIYKVNDAFDSVTARPLAKANQKFTPGPFRVGLSNFFQNLTTPRSVLNNFLQGKPKRGASEFGRFLLNSTVGIGGLVDVATMEGIEEYPEDFGQTAAVWGVPDGPFVTVPFLGPKTLRGAVLLPLDIVANPLYHYDNSSVRDKLYILRVIELRTQFLTAEKLLEDSKDPYLTIRESYLQNREYEIYDGDPPEDDDFYEDFLDEE